MSDPTPVTVRDPFQGPRTVTPPELLPREEPAYVKNAQVLLSNGLYAFPHTEGVALVRFTEKEGRAGEKVLAVLTPEVLATLQALASLNGCEAHRSAVRAHARRVADEAFVQAAFPGPGAG